jgi:hypothetical protein
MTFGLQARLLARRRDDGEAVDDGRRAMPI